MTCLVTREQAGSKTKWLSVANVLATNFLLTLPTDMQQHYPNGGMFLCARCKTSNRRELKFHILFYNAVFSTLTSIKNLSTVSEFKLRPHNSQTLLEDNKHKVWSQHFERLSSSEQFMDGATGGGVPPECPPLSDSLTLSLPFLSQPGAVPQWAREWERTGKKAQWNNITASCLPSPVSFPVWSVQLLDQSDFSQGSSVLHG